jgi:hypothetical protein
MAKATNKKTKDLKAFLFISVDKGKVSTIYDTYNDPVSLAAAFTTAMQTDTELFDILSVAFITFLEDKEKHSSNKSKKPVKTAKKSVNKK